MSNNGNEPITRTPWECAALLRELAGRIAHLDDRIEWKEHQVMRKHFGSLQRPYSRNSLLCILRQLDTERHFGLVFEAEAAVLPTDTLPTLKIACGRFSEAMFVPVGMAVWVDESREQPVLWFKTIKPMPCNGFSDEVLQELLNSNFRLGELIFEALCGVHQGTFDPEQALKYFWPSLIEYINELPGSVITSYAETNAMRSITFTD